MDWSRFTQDDQALKPIHDAEIRDMVAAGLVSRVIAAGSPNHGFAIFIYDQLDSPFILTATRNNIRYIISPDSLVKLMHRLGIHQYQVDISDWNRHSCANPHSRRRKTRERKSWAIQIESNRDYFKPLLDKLADNAPDQNLSRQSPALTCLANKVLPATELGWRVLLAELFDLHRDPNPSLNTITGLVNPDKLDELRVYIKDEELRQKRKDRDSQASSQTLEQNEFAV